MQAVRATDPLSAHEFSPTAERRWEELVLFTEGSVPNVSSFVPTRSPFGTRKFLSILEGTPESRVHLPKRFTGTNLIFRLNQVHSLDSRGCPRIRQHCTGGCLSMTLLARFPQEIKEEDRWAFSRKQHWDDSGAYVLSGNR